MGVSYGGDTSPMHISCDENNREASFGQLRQGPGDVTEVAIVRHQVIRDLALPFARCGVEQRLSGNEQCDAALAYDLGYPVFELFRSSRRQHSSPTRVAPRSSVCEKEGQRLDIEH